jgi:hypothetical protein
MFGMMTSEWPRHESQQHELPRAAVNLYRLLKAATLMSGDVSETVVTASTQ